MAQCVKCQRGLSGAMIHVMSHEPRVIQLAAAEVLTNDTGIDDRALVIEGVRWATVEYSAGSSRSGWCDVPHSGFVVSGAIRYDFEDGRQPLIAAAGDAFELPANPRHRGANRSAQPTRLFLIDSLPGDLAD